MEKKMIMLTNDDGINAEGLSTLYTSLEEDGRFDIRVIAPDRERSSVGHAFTTFHPISLKKEYRHNSFYGHAVGGTPVDCVKLGILKILGRAPDLIISGINRGPNVGEPILCSGTVAAATEGCAFGVPSIAISVNNYIDPDYNYAGKFAKKIAVHVLENGGLPDGTMLNVNVPSIPEDEVKGVKITVQGDAKLIDTYIKRQDPRGKDYYWWDGEYIIREKNKDFDYNVLQSGFVSITPIHHDRTDHKTLDYFQKWNIEK